MILAAALAAFPMAHAFAEPVFAADSYAVVVADNKKVVKTVTFSVGLHCQNCVKKVKENISFEKGVKGLDVNLEKKTVTVSYDPSKTDEATLRKAIEKLGYTCSKPE